MGFRLAILVAAVLAGLAGGYAGMALAKPITDGRIAACAGLLESVRECAGIHDGIS